MLRTRVCLILVAMVVLVPGRAGVLRASLLRAMSLGELTQVADSIVVGNVVSVSAAWDPRHRRILSTIEVDVEESWKGSWSSNRRIVIVQPGGSVGEMEMTVGGMPSFSVGEKSLLFLQGQRPCRVVGMAQGKRTLVWNAPREQWLAEAPDGDDVVEVGPGAKLRQVKHLGPVSLSDLHDQVVRALGNRP